VKTIKTIRTGLIGEDFGVLFPAVLDTIKLELHRKGLSCDEPVTVVTAPPKRGKYPGLDVFALSGRRTLSLAAYKGFPWYFANVTWEDGDHGLEMHHHFEPKTVLERLTYG